MRSPHQLALGLVLAAGTALNGGTALASGPEAQPGPNAGLAVTVSEQVSLIHEDLLNPNYANTPDDQRALIEFAATAEAPSFRDFTTRGLSLPGAITLARNLKNGGIDQPDADTDATTWWRGMEGDLMEKNEQTKKLIGGAIAAGAAAYVMFGGEGGNNKRRDRRAPETDRRSTRTHRPGAA